MVFRKKVLAVDDELSMRVFLATLFETAGYEPVVCRDGTEGLARAKEVRPDLIVLDVMMPGEGGIKMYRALKTDPELCRVPVIMLSAVEGRTFSHSLKMLRLGAAAADLPEPEAYVEKPPRPDDLLRLARDLIGDGEKEP